MKSIDYTFLLLLLAASTVGAFTTRPLRIISLFGSGGTSTKQQQQQPQPQQIWRTPPPVPSLAENGDGTRSYGSSSRTSTRRTTTTSTSTTTALGCQLLGMNCRTASEMSVSWPTFIERGGGTDVHADGWGLAYYPNGQKGLRQFHDVEAASTSPLAQFLGQQNMKTHNMMAHIRYATSGAVDLANVHPFSREMWGINWCFAHNGQISLMDDKPDHWLGDAEGERHYNPIGNTDSEAFFCALLNALRAQFRETMPSLPVLYESILSLCEEVVNYNRDETILNYLLTGGPHVLWTYSWPGRRPGSKVWNGLHYSVRTKGQTKFTDDDYSFQLSMPDNADQSSSTTKVNGENECVNGEGINGDVATSQHLCYDDDGSSSSCCDSCCIVATKPLTTDEEWIELKPGELILFDDGLPHVSPRELFRVELQGHGLDNDGRASIRRPRLEEDMRRYEFQPEFFSAGGI